MTKINIDTTSVKTVDTMLGDVIDIYDKMISVLDYTVVPYNFDRRYAYQSNYSNLKKDKNKLVELRKFVNDSLSDLDSFDEALSNQAKKLPLNQINDKDFSL